MSLTIDRAGNGFIVRAASGANVYTTTEALLDRVLQFAESRTKYFGGDMYGRVVIEREKARSDHRRLAPAAEYVRHLVDCPSIVGHGDEYCTCGAVQFLALIDSLSTQLSAACKTVGPHR